MTARRAWLAICCALLAGGAAAREARAGVEPAPVNITVTGCPAAWESEIRLALAVELGDEHLAGARADEHPAASPGGDAADVRAHEVIVFCEERNVRVTARDAKTAVTLERTLTGDLPAATTPRLIALVSAELLTTFDPALRRRPQAPAKPIVAVAAPAPVSRPAPPPPERPRLLLTAGGVYRTFLSDGGIDAWGGSLDVRRASRGGPWSVGAGVEIADAERATSIGQTSALLASARATVGMLVRIPGDRLVLAFDLGGRIGMARLAGHADDPNVLAATVVRPWAGPVATARVELGFSWFCVEIAAEGGWAAVAASGLVDGGQAVAASGPWLAFSLGVGSWQ